MAAGLPTGTGKINKETLGLIMTSQALLPDGLMPSPNGSIFNSRQNQNESEKSRCATALRVRSQVLAWYLGFLGSCNWFCLILTHAFCRIFSHEDIDLNIQHQFEGLGILLLPGRQAKLRGT